MTEGIANRFEIVSFDYPLVKLFQQLISLFVN